MAKKDEMVIADRAVGGDGEEEIVFDLDDIKCARPGLFTRMLLWLLPRWGVMRLARELGFPLNHAARKAHALLAKVQRVDVLSAIGGARGFQIVLDGTLSLYFSQDGDHFVYDGFEMGEYERGDVTLFDGQRGGWESEGWEDGPWDE